MVGGFRKSDDDPRCKPRKVQKTYFEKLCKTFGPCKGICKPKMKYIIHDNIDCQNCCAYCIKPSSVTKMEKHFLKEKTKHDVHYLKPGALCVKYMEESYLKDRRDRLRADKEVSKELAKQMKAEKKNLRVIENPLKKIEIFVKNKRRELRRKV